MDRKVQKFVHKLNLKNFLLNHPMPMFASERHDVCQPRPSAPCFALLEAVVPPDKLPGCCGMKIHAGIWEGRCGMREKTTYMIREIKYSISYTSDFSITLSLVWGLGTICCHRGLDITHTHTHAHAHTHQLGSSLNAPHSPCDRGKM